MSELASEVVIGDASARALHGSNEAAFAVLEGVKVDGQLNVPEEHFLENIRSSIRRGHQQVKMQRPQGDRVALVCGGPSLESTLPELVDLVAEGAKVVTVNGAYAWCLERNIVPSMQVVIDARAFNSRFIEPALPRCHYVLASQAHPDLWDAVEGRPNVWIFHVGADESTQAAAILNAYYLKRWHNVSGGTTVGTRAIALLRTLGFLRMDVFGMDSCWLDQRHHAYAQAENDSDRRIVFTAHPTDHPEISKKFECAPWHVQQAQDVLQFVRFNGNKFVLNVHGEGLIAFMLRACADVALNQREEGE